MTIDFIKVDISPLREKLLKRLPVPYDALKEDIDNGFSLLYHVYADNISVGVLVLRVDYNYQKEKELVICHAVVEEKPVIPFYKVVTLSLPFLAKRMGCEIIRQHADSKSMARLMARAGYKETEYVFRKRI